MAHYQLAAMRRASQPEAERVPHFLYVNEFHNFTTASFAGIFAEARKYGLCLTICHQYLDQLAEPVRHAVFGNVGTLVSFRVGQRDAELLEREFGGDVKSGNLVSLGRHEVYVRLLEHGLAREPFRGLTLPPLQASQKGRGGLVAAVSREKYGRPRVEVEARIEKWLAS